MSLTIQPDSDLLKWNALGFFILPQDSAVSFAERVKRLWRTFSCEGTEAAQDLVKKYFDIDPSWVEVTYSNEGLYLWEGGCTWYAHDGTEAPVIQLHPSFLK